MKHPKIRSELWKSEPDEHDFPAAAQYLGLLLREEQVEILVDSLRVAELATWKAKDLARASRLPILPAADPDVASTLRKVRKGQRLSPVLLVRGELVGDVPLTVADGYHRICASYRIDEDADIPCRMVDL